MNQKAAARVLLVYGSEPSGHAAAAFSLEQAARRAGAGVSRVVIAGDHHPAAGRAVARGYHRLVRAAPGVWGGLYRSRSARAALKAVRAAYFAFGGAARLRRAIARERPDVVVCPQASVAAVLAEARRRGELAAPVVAVLTDFDAHPFWAEPPADLIVVPTEPAAEDLAAAGVPRSRLRVIGVPISPAFSDLPARADARRALALPSAAPVAMISGGSQGFGELERVADRLLRAGPRTFALVLCGRNERARRSLCAHEEAGRRLRVFGPQPAEFVAAMLAASDLHVGKPGGLTAAESLAAGVPMVLVRPLPGQERANARHLLDAGAAVAASDASEAARAATEALADRERLASMRARAAAAGRPRASEEIVGAVLALAAAQRGGWLSRSQ